MFSRNVNKKWLIDNNEAPVSGNRIVLGVTLPAVSYQPREFGASQVITANADWLNEKNGIYIANTISKLMYQFGYDRKPGMQIYKDMKIKLPIKEGKVDFKFMEDFISELKDAKIVELDIYLRTTGLYSYTLSSEEKKVLQDFEEGGGPRWREFKIGNLFEIRHYGKQRSQEDLQREGELKYNFVMQNENNNGIIERVPEQIGNDFNLIPGNSISAFTHLNKVYYQEKSFYSKQGSNIYTLRNSALNKNRAKFIISAINYIIGEIEYGKNTASRLETYSIQIPTKNNEPDYEMMEIFISAIQKLVIRDVVEYVENKIGGVR